jgi:hypothetical protein
VNNKVTQATRHNTRRVKHDNKVQQGNEQQGAKATKHNTRKAKHNFESSKVQKE